MYMHVYMHVYMHMCRVRHHLAQPAGKGGKGEEESVRQGQLTAVHTS